MMNINKKITILVILMITILPILFICCKEEKSDEIPESEYIDDIVGLKVGILYGFYGNDDKGNNYYAKKGLQKAVEKFRIEPVEDYVKSESEKEIIDKLELLILKSDIIIGVGSDVNRVIYSVIGEKYIDVTFITLGKKSKFYDKDNVIPLTFREYESAYLVGMIAGHNTQTNKIGFFARYPTEIEEDYLYGYKKGARFISPKTDVIGYFGSPDDTDVTIKQKLKKMFYQDVDVLFLTANKWRKIAVEMAKRYKIKLITAYGNFFKEAPENIIASLSIGYDCAVYEVLKLKAQKRLDKKEEISIGIEEGVEPIITNKISDNNYISQKLEKQIRKVKKEIPKGKIFQDYQSMKTITDVEKQ
jgi:basic membrane protein A and related proteins